jgi:predicted O-methyltransferase YrrM
MLELDGVAPPPERSGAARVTGFAKPYLLGLGYSIALFTVGWTTWRGRAAIVDICSRLGYRHDRREPVQLPVVAPDEVTSGATPIRVYALDAIDGNVTEKELVILNSLVVASNARSIFELGTFDGRTTRNLAVNAGSDGHVFTLDLPRESVAALTAPIHAHEERYVDKEISGARYRGTPEEHRITQLYGDSATFDFSRYFGSIDFVFVDASHAYRYVINDSLVALKLLTEEGGVIVWHDYGRWDGVTRALNDLRANHPRFGDLCYVDGTTLAFLRIQQPPK